ncbi:interleukin-23 subunit alpha isoform X2 [Mustela erminea]|uniref:interleukin-23 subunit alpha isoform X2 n=1 Tax=Mustela erminea TaxID=36723 RepID=UPI0013866AA9|nr:interleukin-23 subunit alpha isoform X2 [Mustela erminea]
MLMGIGSLPRFLHGGYFGARGIKTSRGRESAVTSAGNSSFPNSPPRLTLNQTLRRKGRRSPRQSFQSGRAWGSPKPIRRIQDLPREEEDDETTQEVPRIQCGDGCDPQGLEDNSQFCLQRIHQGLVFYEKLLGSDIFTGEPSPLPDGPVGQLHASLLGLRQLLQPEGHHWETEQTPSPSPSQPWQRLLLRFKILRSLQAFVAVAARVFAHGAATLSP